MSEERKSQHPIRPQSRIKQCMNNSVDTDDHDGVLCPMVEGTEESGGEGRKRARAESTEGSREEPDDVEGEEARGVSAPPIPCTPSLKEVLEHRLTHQPYRSWCPHCVRGKGGMTGT